MTRRNGSAAPRSRLSLYLVAVLIPFVFVGTLETVFRLTGIGVRQALFIPAPVEGYLQPNSSVIHRFFPAPQTAPKVSIDTSYFLEKKPEGALRIVVQGGSSAAGFPYSGMASPAGMLQQRMERSFPDRTVEVINTAMSAVNSYTLLDFADEIIDIEPDAVVIYAGHNEFIGVLGVGSAYSSSLSPKLTRLVLRLRRLNLVEAGYQVYGAALPAADSGTGTLMSRMAAEHRIPYGGEVFSAGQQQFRENLGLLLAKYRRHDIPVFIGTLASNEKDQPPFIPADVPMSVAKTWHEISAQADRAVKAERADEASMKAGELVKMAPENAMSWFMQGNASLLRGRPSEARHAFLKAKDLDELRFRAPESFNDIIRAAALDHGAVLVDVQQALASRSPNGIIGSELMLEHLHPNVDGYFYMADAFYDAMVRMDVTRPTLEINDDTALSEIPVTAIDRLHGMWRIERLMHDWPFVAEREPYSPPSPKTETERIARDWYDGKVNWIDTMNRALGYYSGHGDATETARIAAILATTFPFEPDPAYIAGVTLLSKGESARALPYLSRAARLEPLNTRYLMSLAQAFYVADRPEDSLAVLQQVVTIEPGHKAASSFIDKLRSELADAENSKNHL